MADAGVHECVHVLARSETHSRRGRIAAPAPAPAPNRWARAQRSLLPTQAAVCGRLGQWLGRASESLRQASEPQKMGRGAAPTGRGPAPAVIGCLCHGCADQCDGCADRCDTRGNGCHGCADHGDTWRRGRHSRRKGCDGCADHGDTCRNDSDTRAADGGFWRKWWIVKGMPFPSVSRHPHTPGPKGRPMRRQGRLRTDCDSRAVSPQAT